MVFHTDFTNADSLTLEFDLFRDDLRLNFNWLLRIVFGTNKLINYFYFEIVEIKEKDYKDNLVRYDKATELGIPPKNSLV